MSKSHRTLLFRDAFLSTVFVFACIAIFALNPFNFHVFDSLGATFKDIEFTDILFSDKNPNTGDIKVRTGSEIVLINAADRGRGEMAALINKINEEKPAVLGVDFIFEGPKDPADDSLLKAALAAVPKVVVASKFKDNEKDGRSNYMGTSPRLGTLKEGYANFMVNGMEKSVRYFRAKDNYNGKEVLPFALEVVRQFKPDKAEKFYQRGKEFELINYEGNLNTFDNYNGNDIGNGNFPEGYLTGKIVLLGFFGSDCNSNPILDDNFYTPMNKKIVGRKFPDTYGVVIHANIINMVLKERYVAKTPVWLDWLIGFLVCFLHNFAFIWLYVHKHLWYHFYAKMIQLFTTFALVFVCIYFFKEMNIKLSASPFIIPVLLSVDLLYFYDTIVKWLHKKFKTKTYFLTGPLHH